MFGERKGGKGYNSGGLEKEWLGCLKAYSQRHEPNGTTHHTSPTTHDTPHPII